MYLQSAHQTKINIFIYAVFFICSFIVNIGNCETQQLKYMYFVQK